MQKCLKKEDKQGILTHDQAHEIAISYRDEGGLTFDPAYANARHYLLQDWAKKNGIPHEGQKADYGSYYHMLATLWLRARTWTSPHDALLEVDRPFIKFIIGRDLFWAKDITYEEIPMYLGGQARPWVQKASATLMTKDGIRHFAYLHNKNQRIVDASTTSVSIHWNHRMAS